MMNYLKKVKRKAVSTLTGGIPEKLVNIDGGLRYLLKLQEQEIEQNRILTAQLHIERIKQLREISSLKEVEFKVFSQFGHDGILQYLIHNIEIPNPVFIEFGAAYYHEATTRFLLTNNLWKGLIMDGSEEYMNIVRSSDLYWQHELEAKTAFITKENIDQLIHDYTPEEDIGLMVIDLDGNDYWVWDAIKSVKPRIVFCECNSIFGPDKKVTVPYQADFDRGTAHFSGTYYGASVAALVHLGESKGYRFLGCTSQGNDVIFVRADVLPAHIKATSAREGYVESHFRDTRNEAGELTFVGGKDRLKLMRDKEVFDIDQQKLVKVADLYGI